MVNKLKPVNPDACSNFFISQIYKFIFIIKKILTF